MSIRVKWEICPWAVLLSHASSKHHYMNKKDFYNFRFQDEV
jgi:hypothetical protein